MLKIRPRWNYLRIMIKYKKFLSPMISGKRMSDSIPTKIKPTPSSRRPNPFLRRILPSAWR